MRERRQRGLWCSTARSGKRRNPKQRFPETLRTHSKTRSTVDAWWQVCCHAGQLPKANRISVCFS